MIDDRQAVAVTQVLRKLPTDLGADAERQAEATMVGFCDTFDSHHLAGLSEFIGKPISLQSEAAFGPAMYDIVLL